MARASADSSTRRRDVLNLRPAVPAQGDFQLLFCFCQRASSACDRCSTDAVPLASRVQCFVTKKPCPSARSIGQGLSLT